ncbi:MAG: translation initiation factor IF-3 [Acidobacteriota bacterium]
MREPVSKGPRLNRQIRVREIRVVDEDGAQLGIMTPEQAMVLAESKGLDLVEVAPLAQPPVCRIIDYGKYLYDEKKKAAEAKKKQRQIVVKEIKLRPKIEEHDYQVKKRQIEAFLEDGDKVKVTVRFRGREIVHPEMAQKLLSRIATEVVQRGKIERAPMMEARTMVMLLMPAKK